MFCAIWYHLYNLKNVKNTHGGVLLLVKLQTFYQHTGKVGLGTWDPYLGPRTGDPGPGTLHLEPRTWDLICGTLFKEQIHGTKVRKPIWFIRAQFFELF